MSDMLGKYGDTPGAGISDAGGIVRTIHDANNNHIGISDGIDPIPLAMVYAFPDTPQVYTSPIAGDPDLANQQGLHGIQHLGVGFLLPKAGILTEIGFIAQGSNGAGVSRNLRYSVCALTQDNTSTTGLKVAANLLTGIKVLADNFDGQVAITGLSLAVPSQFMVFLKAPYNNAGGTKVQNCLSAGPIPGVVGGVNGGQLTSTAAYGAALIDIDGVTPVAIPVGDKPQPLAYKGISVYIKWKGQ